MLCHNNAFTSIQIKHIFFDRKGRNWKAMWKSAIVGRIQLIGTYNKVDKRKSSKTMEGAATAYGKLKSADLEDE